MNNEGTYSNRPRETGLTLSAVQRAVQDIKMCQLCGVFFKSGDLVAPAQGTTQRFVHKRCTL